MLKNVFISMLTFVFCLTHSIQGKAATRTWSGAGSGTIAWAGNWGTDPVAGDDIEITTTGTLIITGMPALALNSVKIHGGGNFTVEFQGANTLTIGGNAGADFVIDASTGFILSATNAPSITMAASATSTINGPFTINAGCTWTMSNASVVNTISTSGAIINSGTITGSTTAKLIFEGVSSYTHAQNGGTIPTADWDGAGGTATSTCTVTGMTTTKPGGLVTTSNTFYHFVWNCTAQSATLLASGQGCIAASGENFTTLGDFTISSSNGQTIAFSEITAGALSTLTVGGDMGIDDPSTADFYFNYGTTPVTVNISGDLNIGGADVYGVAGGTGAATTINVTGSVNLTAGWLTVSYSNYSTVTLDVTLDVVVSGAGLGFNGVWTGTGSPTILIGRDLSISTGASAAINTGAGSPTITITRDLLVSGGSFSGNEGAGTPTINVTRDVTVSGTGEFYGTSGSALSTYVIGGDVSVTAAGADFYGSDDTGGASFTITGDIIVSAGNFYGTYDDGAPTYTVTGNLTQTGGTFMGTYWNGSPTFTISGNVAISGTGTFIGSDDAGDPTYNITGSLTVSGGATTFYGQDWDATGIPVFNIQGAVDLSTGTVGATDGSPTSTTPMATFNLTGAASNTLNLKTGLTYDSGCPWTWTISAGRTITLSSDVEIGGTASSCVFTNNGILIMGTNTFPAVTTAVGSFVNASGATLKTAHLSGLSTTAATGAVQVTGTTTFSSGASYVFNGAAAQVTGNFGAATTPTANTVANLELDNSSGVSLTAGLIVADAGTLTLTDGYHDLGAFTLQLGTSAANTLTYTTGGLYSSTDNGSLKRYVPAGAVTSTSGNYYGLFPFKASAINENVMELNSTANVTTGGFITATAGFTTAITDVADYADDNSTIEQILTGKSIDIVLTTIAGGTFNVEITNGDFPGSATSDYTLATYTGSSESYEGTFAATAGTTSNPKVKRTGVSTANLAQSWVIGTYNWSASPLPIELFSFYGNKMERENELRWVTMSETNNAHFDLERSEDGVNFEWIGSVPGAGNSNYIIEYSFIDSEIKPFVNYYRLNQFDFDGNSTYSKVISIDNRNFNDNKEILRITNLLGQDVNEGFSGIVLIVYMDGTTSKEYR